MAESTQQLHDKFEPRPDPVALTGSSEDSPHNVNRDVDYEPHPDQSLKISPEHEQIVKHITNLYSGSCSEEDMQVYAEKAIYDDPLSYCDTRYKIAGKSVDDESASAGMLTTTVEKDNGTVYLRSSAVSAPSKRKSSKTNPIS